MRPLSSFGTEDEYVHESRPSWRNPVIRRNPELVLVNNPRHRPRASAAMGEWGADVNPRRRAKTKRSNPALTKLIGKKRYTYASLFARNLALALRGKKRKSFKTFILARKRANKKTRSMFKKGYVYHRGMKLRIVGWSKTGDLRGHRRRRRK